MMDFELYKNKLLEILFFGDVDIPEWASWFAVDDQKSDHSDLFCFYQHLPHLSDYENLSIMWSNVNETRWQGIYKTNEEEFDYYLNPQLITLYDIPNFNSKDSLISVRELFDE